MNQAIEQGLSHLLNWATRVKFTDIPLPVVRRAALVVADDLSAMVASRNEPEIRQVHQKLLQDGTKPEATVFRGGRPMADRYSVAVANGAAADWAELDEGYRKAVCHAGLYCLPALLAEAEAVRANVKEVLRCCVVSYEITTRFARARNGMRAVDWVQCGIGGLPSTPNDVYAGALGAKPHLEELTEELGKEWAISDGYHSLLAASIRIRPLKRPCHY